MNLLIDTIGLFIEICLGLTFVAVSLLVIGFVIWIWWMLMCLIVKFIILAWPVFAVLFVLAFLAKAISR